ncbi:MAG: hypothetical protein PHD48_00430 [Alphaproteobacteria bacterium]|nr:hypothetical protein [Alphaproteobacteria bacterium]
MIRSEVSTANRLRELALSSLKIEPQNTVVQPTEGTWEKAVKAMIDSNA